MFMLDIADGARSTGASGAAFRGRDHLAYQGLWAAEANAAERGPANAAHFPDADFVPPKTQEVTEGRCPPTGDVRALTAPKVLNQ